MPYVISVINVNLNYAYNVKIKVNNIIKIIKINIIDLYKLDLS